ncbi:Protocadherin-8 [Sciurus carolinensis]|uniref:Protocadherin-8 n=1 Tax=Sciurus carolinensis TaxID=30640 RepID=A0AA41SXX3_SCICA|nr:Protocadherin-8 [Sciurus carolinensis]
MRSGQWTRGYPGRFHLSVPEGSAQESSVVLVSTSDRDSDSNGQVRCALYGHEHLGRTIVLSQVEDQKDHAPHLVALMLFNSSSQLPLPWGTLLGYVVTGLPVEDADQGFNADLTCSLLRNEGSFGVLALHPVTGELSLQRHLSFQPSDPLTTVFEVRNGGRPTLSCIVTLLLVPSDLVTPGGKVVLVPPPSPPPPPQPQKGRRTSLEKHSPESSETTRTLQSLGRCFGQWL